MYCGGHKLISFIVFLHVLKAFASNGRKVVVGPRRPQCNVFSSLLYYAVQELIGQGFRVSLYLQRAMVTGDTRRDTARDSGASQSVKQRGCSEERSAYGRTDGQSNYLLLGVILNLAHSSFVTILFWHERKPTEEFAQTTDWSVRVWKSDPSLKGDEQISQK